MRGKRKVSAEVNTDTNSCMSLVPVQTVWIPSQLAVLPVLWKRHVADSGHQRGEKLPRLQSQLLPDPSDRTTYDSKESYKELPIHHNK